jgi:HTH-type transcriptional regulator / antitoxin HigA
MTLTFNSQHYGDLLSCYQPRLIRTESENEAALVMIERLMHSPDRSPEENELYDLLILLVAQFEQSYYQPGRNSSPASMLQFLMEQQGLALFDIAQVIGSEVQVADLLAGKDEMTIAQVRALAQFFKVDTSVFV